MHAQPKPRLPAYESRVAFYDRVSPRGQLKSHRDQHEHQKRSDNVATGLLCRHNLMVSDVRSFRNGAERRLDTRGT